MRDPFSWSFPIGRLFGIPIRVHILLLVVFLGLYLRVATSDKFPAGAGADQLTILGLLFLSVLLHELGHCYGAHLVEGEAREILLWPLGGLASLDTPHTPRALFISTAMGPAVNLLLCLVSGGVLAAWSLVPPFNPFWNPFSAELHCWTDNAVHAARYLASYPQLDWWQILVARFFWLNWILFLLNVVICAYPLDGGQMLQAILWPRLGHRRSTLTAVFVGFVFMFLILIYGLAANEVFALALAMFILVYCRQQWIVLETGGEESLFGYDFSQGYTSLEKDQPLPQPRRKRSNFLQRWLQRRAQKKMQREQEQQVAEEHRMDELLDKIQRLGKGSLTDEEHRFLKRVADRYRNRH